jgi:Arc/MetJ-type ribon-helix-helix transcriptional regulator
MRPQIDPDNEKADFGATILTPQCRPEPGTRLRRCLKPPAVSAPGLGPVQAGMVTGMATRKVTVTLDAAQLEQIRSLVQAGSAPSVSGFVQHAVAIALDDIAGWGAMLAEALRQTGGPLSDDERAWADDVLSTSSRPGRSAA